MMPILPAKHTKNDIQPVKFGEDGKLIPLETK